MFVSVIHWDNCNLSKYLHTPKASQVAQWVKNLPAMQETPVWSLDGEDLEKGMATHSSILPGEAQGQRSPGGYSP